MAAKTNTEHYYSAHNVATSVSSTRKHQYTTAISTMWTESSWAFPESYTADVMISWIAVRSSDGGHGETKGLITSPPRWYEFLHNYCALESLHDSDHEDVVRTFAALSCELWGYLFN